MYEIINFIYVQWLVWYLSVRCPSLGVKWQSSEADSPQLHIAKAECIKLYPFLLHRPWCCAQGWPHFILYRPKNPLYLFNVQNTWHWIFVVYCFLSANPRGPCGWRVQMSFLPIWIGGALWQCRYATENLVSWNWTMSCDTPWPYSSYNWHVHGWQRA